MTDVRRLWIRSIAFGLACGLFVGFIPMMVHATSLKVQGSAAYPTFIPNKEQMTTGWAESRATIGLPACPPGKTCTLITLEPERHRLCETIMAYESSMQGMSKYHCERDNHELDLLGYKGEKTDCALAMQRYGIHTFFNRGEPEWTVRCTDADTPWLKP